MSWPSGGQDLVVANGTTYRLAPNDIPHFKNVIIQKGGTFIIGTSFFAANPWAIVGCSGDFILQGTLLVRGSPIFESKTYQFVAPDGVNLNRNFVQSNGAPGGAAYTTPQQPGGGPGAPQFGNGGGGGAPHGNGYPASANQGGSGGTTHMSTPPNQWHIGAGGAGGSVASNENSSAGNGQDGGSQSGGVGATGGGGGGGARGLHGGLLYLRVRGHFIATDGLIDMSGGDGGKGGNGGSASNRPPQRPHASGAGGGGGAGGNGGYALVRFGKNLQRGLENTAAGRGGSGGAAGSASDSWGKPGTAGQSGASGMTGEISYEHQA